MTQVDCGLPLSQECPWLPVSSWKAAFVRPVLVLSLSGLWCLRLYFVYRNSMVWSLKRLIWTSSLHLLLFSPSNPFLPLSPPVLGIKIWAVSWQSPGPFSPQKSPDQSKDRTFLLLASQVRPHPDCIFFCFMYFPFSVAFLKAKKQNKKKTHLTFMFVTPRLPLLFVASPQVRNAQ